MVLRSYAEQARRAIVGSEADIVFSPGTVPIAYLDVDQLIAFWTDATFRQHARFLPSPDSARRSKRP
jgi:hypothetical protein